MPRRMNPGIILLLLCVCSSSLSSGWPSLLASSVAAGLASSDGKPKKDELLGTPKKKCIIKPSNANYTTEECKRFNIGTDHPEWYLGMQGLCNQGDTMVGYTDLGCDRDSYKGNCMNGPPGGKWNWPTAAEPECEVTPPKDTTCKVTMYASEDWEDDDDDETDTMELNRSIHVFSAPFNTISGIGSIKSTGNCSKVLLHSNLGFSGNQHNVLTAGDGSNKELSGSWNSITIEGSPSS